MYDATPLFKFESHTKEQLVSEVQRLYQHLEAEKAKCFGIQINQDVNDSQLFAPLLSHNLNNLGDPFTGTGGHLVTFEYEQELVRLVASLLHLNSEDAWGYFTSGSTISNIHGVHLGMKRFADPVLVISEDAHNSFLKAAEITRCKHVIQIKTNRRGEMSVNDFADKIKRSSARNFLIVLCSGTVNKGAYDNADELLGALNVLGIDKERYYLHIDAALGGMITPFLESHPINLDFSLPQADSLAVSFHKRVGIPVPGSLFIARRQTLNSLPECNYAEHYSSYDTTIAGSRDGLTPFITLMKMKLLGYQGLVKQTRVVLDRAAWCVDLMQKNGVAAWHNRHSPCVVLPAPSRKLLDEYHLPLYKSPDGDYTHVFTMEHVTEQRLTLFVEKYLDAGRIEKRLNNCSDI